MRPTADGARARRLAALLTGLAVGATVWLSLGVLALVDPARMTRVGALPPYGWLGVLAVVAGARAGGVPVVGRPARGRRLDGGAGRRRVAGRRAALHRPPPA